MQDRRRFGRLKSAQVPRTPADAGCGRLVFKFLYASPLQLLIGLDARAKKIKLGNATPVSLPAYQNATQRLDDLTEAERLKLALLSAAQTVFDWTPGDGRIHWGDGAAEVLHLVSIDPVASLSGFESCLDADTAALRKSVLAAATAERPTYRVEYEFAHAQGPEIWLEETATCLFDDQNELARVIGIVREITDRKQLEARLRHQSSYDELTGHLNRARLKERLAETLVSLEASGETALYLLAGIDELAVLNESLGYEVADQIIVATGSQIASVVSEDGAVGRIAGNKFAVLLKDCAEGDAAARALDLIEAVRQADIDTSAGRIKATISIGTISLPRDAASANLAMARAEEALAQAKLAGRNCHRAWAHSPNSESRRKRNSQIADQIMAALQDDRVSIAFQPIVSAATTKPVQYEGLVRIVLPDGSLLPAAEFIEVAEQMGLVRLLDERVLDLTVQALKANPNVELALNVSGLSTRDAAWSQALEAAVGDAPDLAARLTVELTETQAIRDLGESTRFVQRLTGLGCRVAIDDFGAGYTSFLNLKALDVHSVKIDGTFIRGLAGSRENQHFVRTLVSLAKSLDLSTVAEWVSCEEERILLRDMGVDHLQGYYFGAPSLRPDWAKD